jgi:hypothetical protein
MIASLRRLVFGREEKKTLVICSKLEWKTNTGIIRNIILLCKLKMERDFVRSILQVLNKKSE